MPPRNKAARRTAAAARPLAAAPQPETAPATVVGTTQDSDAIARLAATVAQSATAAHLAAKSAAAACEQAALLAHAAGQAATDASNTQALADAVAAVQAAATAAQAALAASDAAAKSASAMHEAAVGAAASQHRALPPGASMWDRLSADLQSTVIAHAGPLTGFLCGMLGTKDDVGVQTAQAIWHQVIALDWQGDLDLLPAIQPSHIGNTCDVRSRLLFTRLRTRFPRDPHCSINVDLNKYTVIHSNIFLNVMGHISCDGCLHHIAMRHGWLDLIDFSHPIALGWVAICFGYDDLLCHLADTHHVNLARYGTLYTMKAMDWAASGGHVDVLETLHDAGSKACTVNAMNEAATNGHLDAVQWLYNHLYDCTEGAMDGAAANGHLEILEWINWNMDVPATMRAMDGACEARNLAVMQWLHDHRAEGCSMMAMETAEAARHDEVSEWLRATYPRKYAAYLAGEDADEVEEDMDYH